MKDVRLSSPLTETMKIVRLISPLPDLPRLSSPRPRLRHGRQLSLPSHLNLTPKTVYYLLRSVGGSSSLSFSSPNIPNCSSTKESVSVFVAYLISHFSAFQPKLLPSRARDYLSELRQTMCPEESHLSFCSPLSSTELLAAAINLSSSTVTGPNKVAYPMLKPLLLSGIDFSLNMFSLFWFYILFLPSGRHLIRVIPIHMMGYTLDSPASLQPISLTSCVSKFFERIILIRPLFFLKSNSILFHCQAGFCPGRSTVDRILFFFQSISDGIKKRSSLQLISRKLSTLSGIPPFSTESFRLAAFLALLFGLNLSFLVSALAQFIKITKVAPFEPVEVFCKDPFLALCVFLFLLMISLRLCLLSSAALFMLTIWPFGSLPLGPSCGEGHTWSSNSIGALV